jgi:diadenosine tetraphosphate (Ap4A) HIT family hydrolase
MAANCLICERVQSSEEGKNPFLIHEFRNSFLVLGDHQYFKGYSVLLLKDHIRELHELPPFRQQELFRELMAAGQAVFEAFQPWKMNYSCYGNQIPHVHWHIFPRYESDPDHLHQPWLHSPDFEKHATQESEMPGLIAKIQSKLKE